MGGIYLLLLPFGGYRSYRVNIIRADTFMPVALALFYFYGLSTLFLLTQISAYKKYYVVAVVLFILAFTNADRPVFEPYYCERRALEKLASAPERTVKFSEGCSVMSWEQFVNPEDSRLNSLLLEYWNIIPEKKYYYFEAK